MNKWAIVKLGSINKYQSRSVNPMREPDTWFELYSVPSYENDYPEIVIGNEIGSTKQVVQEGDVLLCKINPRINRVWSVKKHTKYPQIASSEWIVIRNNDIFTNYLVWFLKSKPFRNLITTNVTGIGGSLTRVQPKQVKEYQVPLPPIETQKKIAEVLDKAQELINKRKDQNSKLDEFIQSIFIEMFGDPVTNPKGWKILILQDVCRKISDGTHHSPNNNQIGDYLYITAKNIKKDKIDLANVTYISAKDHKNIYARCNPEYGDILYIKDGVTTGIAQINTLNDEFSMLSSVALLKLKKEIISEFYLRAFLNNEAVYSAIRENMGGAAITRLTLNKIANIKICCPPLDLQIKFAKIVMKVEQQKALLEKSLAEMENNFNSIMQRAFKGELF